MGCAIKNRGTRCQVINWLFVTKRLWIVHHLSSADPPAQVPEERMTAEESSAGHKEGPPRGQGWQGILAAVVGSVAAAVAAWMLQRWTLPFGLSLVAVVLFVS